MRYIKWHELTPTERRAATILNPRPAMPAPSSAQTGDVLIMLNSRYSLPPSGWFIVPSSAVPNDSYYVRLDDNSE